MFGLTDQFARRLTIDEVMGREYEVMRDAIVGAPDTASAWSELAGHWLRLHQTRQEAMTKLRDDGGASAAVLGALRIFDAPALRHLPFAALGLRRAGDDAGAPVWIGTPAMLGAAAEAMAYLGHLAVFSPDRDHAELRRDGQLAATLLADPEHVEPEGSRPPDATGPDHRPLVIGLSTLASGLGLMRWGNYEPGLLMLVAAPVPPLTHALVRYVRRRRPRGHRIIATLAVEASPYRGEHRPSRPELAQVGAALTQAGLPTRRRGRRLRVEPDVIIAPDAGDAGFVIMSKEVPSAVRCVHAMAAVTGPLQVQYGRSRIVVAGPDAFPTWEAQRAADDAARAALLETLAGGYRAVTGGVGR